jgi:hypothetical protein
LLQRFWSHVDILQSKVFSFEAEVLLPPSALQDGQGFFHTLAALTRGDAEGSELFGSIPGRHPEVHSPSRNEVQHGRVLGNPERMM